MCSVELTYPHCNKKVTTTRLLLVILCFYMNLFNLYYIILAPPTKLTQDPQCPYFLCIATINLQEI